MIKKEDLDQDHKEMALDQDTTVGKAQIVTFNLTVMEIWVEIMDQ